MEKNDILFEMSFFFIYFAFESQKAKDERQKSKVKGQKSKAERP